MPGLTHLILFAIIGKSLMESPHVFFSGLTDPRIERTVYNGAPDAVTVRQPFFVGRVLPYPFPALFVTCVSDKKKIAA
jgi:hypothetical protein